MTGTYFDGTGDGEGEAKTERLHNQLVRVYLDLHSQNDWTTLEAIASRVNAPTPSVSARIRDLRKERFGGHIIEQRHDSNGLHEYRLLIGSGNPDCVRHPLAEAAPPPPCTHCDGTGKARTNFDPPRLFA